MFVSPAVFMIEQFANPSENRLRRLAGNLLRYNVLDDGRKEIGLNRPAYAPDLVNNLPQPPVPRLEVFHLLLAVSEVHLLFANLVYGICGSKPILLLLLSLLCFVALNHHSPALVC